MRTGVIFGCHQNPTLERQILTRVGFEPELGFIDSGLDFNPDFRFRQIMAVRILRTVIPRVLQTCRS